MLRLAVIFLCSCSAFCADWYSSVTATPAGDGSITNPWPLTIALTNSGAIQPGDTLYLRGGNYRGPGFISSLSGTAENYITVCGYTNEWPVLTDGAAGTLLTEMSGVVSNTTITISGSELWSELIKLQMGGEVLYVLSRSGTNWTVIPGWDSTDPTPHSVGETVTIHSGVLEQNGSYVRFQDFEITCLGSTNRVIGTNRWLAYGLYLNASGTGNKAVNLVIHNTGHPGIGFWQQGAGGEVNGCVMWGVGQYYNDGTAIAGTAIYSQNESGMAEVKNTLSFRNFTGGMKVFGESGPVRDFRFSSNWVVGLEGYGSINIASGSTATSNTWMVGNLLINTPQLSYVSLWNRDQIVACNTIIGGKFEVGETTNSFYTNNIVFYSGTDQGGYDSVYLNLAELGIVWDHNTYYFHADTSPWKWTFGAADVVALNSQGGGLLRFDGDSGKSWTNWSGFDVNSPYQETWPTDYLNVQAVLSDYDVNRWHIGVVNSSSATNATLDLASIGFSVGQSYTLRDAQNYFTTIASGVYAGGSISLPLMLTNVATINGELNPDTLSTEHVLTNRHTNIDYPGLFNAFVLTRSGSARHAHTHGSGTLGSSTR